MLYVSTAIICVALKEKSQMRWRSSGGSCEKRWKAMPETGTEGGNETMNEIGS